MRLGIMQPYFFPYPGHFALIARTDEWVVFDIAQYTRKSWMNRNRVLHPSGGWMYVTVPVSGVSRSARVADIYLEDPAAARTHVLGKLSHYRRCAPYYTQVCGIVEETFDDPGDGSLVSLNVRGLVAVCRYLEIGFRYRLSSTFEVDLPPVDHPGGWALEISTMLGADEYVNPTGGRALFDDSEFRRRGIGLSFLESPPIRYDTAPFAFVPDLSILDAAMWMASGDLRRALGRANPAAA